MKNHVLTEEANMTHIQWLRLFKYLSILMGGLKF